MKNFMLVISLLLLATNSYAAPSVAPQPVIDLKSLAQLEQQVTQLTNMYDQLAKTAAEVKSIKSNTSGLFTYGNMHNDLSSWQWTAGTWNQELAELAGGNPARYNELVNEYEKSHPVMTSNQYSQGASTERAAIYQQNSNINKTAYVEAAKEFNDINQRLSDIHDLTVQIDTADTSKKAMDLNSRLLAQVAYLQAEQLRMQTLINQQYVQTQAAQLDEDSLASQFNKLPTT